MEDSKGQVIQSAAQVYDEFFVPALFAEWSPRIVERCAIRPDSTVLDVACGTGVLAREVARIADPRGVVGLDCNEGMLAVAAQKEPKIRWHKGLAEDLGLASESFDSVVSQFGLMFFEDQVQALREMWRVLRPGGTLVVAVWGRLEETPGYACMVELLARLFGERIANELRAPFSLGDPDSLLELFTRAEIASASIETVVGKAHFPSLAEWVHTDIRGWTLADKISNEEYEVLRREAPQALHQFVGTDGVSFDSPANLVRAQKPAR